MKKTYQLQELDCADCAAKIEDAISKLDGVESASVNFITQKLIITAEDHRFETIIEQAKKVIHKIEPDCVLVS